MAKTSTTQFYSFFGKEALLGGLNVTDNPLMVQQAEMTVAENISVAQTLARKKRPGQTNYHLGSFASTASYPTIGTGHPIRGILQYWRYASATSERTEDLFLHQDTKVWSIESQNSAAINRTGSVSVSNTGIPSYQVFQGILYWCSSDTSEGFNKWNGVATVPGNATSATAPPDGAGKYLGVYNAQLVMAGNPDFPFRLYLSDTLDGEDWTTGQATSFDVDYDGDPNGITSIFPSFQGRLFFATRRRVYELTGTDLTTFEIKPITKGVGCVSHQSVVATANDILFASDRGVHSLNKLVTSDQTEINFLSRPIQKLWTDLLATNLLTQIQAVWEDTSNLYVATVPSSGQATNDTVLVYNINYNLWTLWTDVDARSLSTVLLNEKQYVLAGREDGKISYLNPSLKTDFGSGFSGRFKTGKLFPGGDIVHQKMFKSITILCSATTASQVDVSWEIDGTDVTKSSGKTVSIADASSLLGSTFILGQSTLGIGKFIPKRISIEDVGFNIQFQIQVSGDSDIEFYGYILEVETGDPSYA